MSTRRNTRQNRPSSGPSAPPATPRTPFASRALDISTPSAQSSPAVVEAPRPRKRQKTPQTELNDKSTEEVWDLDDQIIIDAAKAATSSKTYEHYTWSLVRSEAGGLRTMTYHFTCAFGDARHTLQTRIRGEPYNTSNLGTTARTCIARDPSRASKSTTPNCWSFLEGSSPGTTYTPARYRTLLVLRSAAHKRPHSEVEDYWYRKEVEMWRPGTPIPSSDTVAADGQRLYVGLAPVIARYFAKRGRDIHAIVDGWTNPIADQILGCNIQWEDDGQLYEMTLEFIKITSSHTGEHLAEALATTLKRFGLDLFLHLLMMDNAGNCNTTATALTRFIPTFLGKPSRARCFDHIGNLIARIILSFFFKKPKRKVADSSSAPAEAFFEDTSVDEDEIEVETSLGEDGDIPGADNAARETHDREVVKTLRDIAIHEMRQRGIVISGFEEKDALALFPKVAGLAKKVHDSGTIKSVFAGLVDAIPNKKHNTQILARRNATRWGSEMKCLKTRRRLLPAVEKLLGDRSLKLGAFKLNEKQENLSVELERILRLIEIPMKIFQLKEHPLIIEVIPAMEQLRQAFERCEADASLSDVSRVAVHAGLLLLKKYYDLLGDCDAYRIAVAMCPHRRLAYFRDVLRWNEDQISELRQLVIRRFEEYFPPAPTTLPPTPPRVSRTIFGSHPDSDDIDISSWISAPPTTSSSNTQKDCIRSYLDDPVVTEPVEGVLVWWNAARTVTPEVAEFALSYCSGPATSCGGERSFSEGRHQVDWNQHSMSTQTFRERVALSSWSKMPFFKLEDAIGIIAASAGTLRS